MSRLPPFFALRALEAASRHHSYSAAAGELAVTHGAVSQQIRRLEAELGARLFQRRGNAMIPTPEAVRLASEVRRGVNMLQNAVAEFTAAGRRDPLVVSVDAQYAARWLPSRLNRLLNHPAGAGLEVLVDDRLANFVTDGVDMGLRYGRGDWPDLEMQLLLPEVLIAVCSPKLAGARRLRSPADLLSAPLLHHAHRPWSLWFEAFGLAAPPRQGMLFDESLMLYEAAAQGLGVAVARQGLIHADLETGRLVQVGGGEVPTDRGFYAVWRADSRKAPRILALRDWLVTESTEPCVDSCRAA